MFEQGGVRRKPRQPAMDTRLLALLWYANIAGEILVVLRLIFSGLVRPYKWFTLYIGFSAARELAMVIMSSHDITAKAGWLVYSLTEPVILGLQILVVVEVYNGIAEGYYGIGSFGTRLLAVATGIGIIVSGVLSAIDARGYSPWLFLVKRDVAAILVMFLLCVAWMLLYIKATLRPNVIIHCRILTLYLAGNVFGYFGANIGVPRVTASLLMLTCCLVSFLLWAILLHRDGERVPATHIMTEEEYQQNQRQKQALLDVGRWLKPPFWRRVKIRAAGEPLR
jgi:hypothetical protein